MASNNSERSSSSRSRPKSKRADLQVCGQSRNIDPSKRVLSLQKSPASFEPPTSKESVFFDECNREIINLTSGLEGKTKVTFQSAEATTKVQFLIPVEKRILSIKLNPTKSVLAYHIEKSTIEFINVTLRHDTTVGGDAVCELESRRYQQSTRARNAKLSGFLWTGPCEMVMISDTSVEYYHVDSQRHRLRHMKSFPSSTNWFVFQPAANVSDAVGRSHSMLVVSTGSIGNAMQPYAFLSGQVVKLQRFEVEGNWLGSNKLELFERSITMASIYGLTRLLVLQHESLNLKSRGAQILIYTIDCDTGTTSKTHTLDLDINGRFALNVVDNLVVAHDQPSRSSFIFDIMIESTEKSDCPRHYVSLIDSQPIRALELGGKDIQMYSLNWVFFQPNFIIDAKMGLLCTLDIELENFREAISDNLLLLTFLSQRFRAETIILNKIREVVDKSFEQYVDPNQEQPRGNPLAEISSSFEILADLVSSELQLDKTTTQQKSRQEQPTISTMPTAGAKLAATSISQQDIHRHLFSQLDSIVPHQCQETKIDFAVSTLLEFVLMVSRLGKNVDPCIYESLVRNLTLGHRYFQIVQLIRAGVLRDSKQLACVLLSLREQYKPAAEMGIDMLNRLDCLKDLIESLNMNAALIDSSQEISRRLSEALYQSLELGAA